MQRDRLRAVHSRHDDRRDDQPGGIVTGYCYVYTLLGLDNVGNAASIRTTVMVDTSTPTTPTLAFGGLSANAYYGSAFNTLYFRPAAGGAYTVTASSTDSVSGIAGYTYSSLAGNGFAATQTGGQNAYTFGASATQPGSAPTVLATSNAGDNSATATYKLISDTAAPSGGALTVNGTAASTAGSSTTAPPRASPSAPGHQLRRDTVRFSVRAGVEHAHTAVVRACGQRLRERRRPVPSPARSARRRSQAGS